MIKYRIQNFLRGFGVELRRYHTNTSEHRARLQSLSHLGIDLILDVGANRGQYAEELMSSGYTGRIVSFEPLSKAHAELRERCSRVGCSRWLVHDRVAIGAASGSATIYIAANSVSSSLLPTLQSHLRAAPESETVGSEDVSVSSLDDAAMRYLKGVSKLLIKVDTQGFEWQVLDGSSKTLDAAAAIQLELSLVPLYAGQRMWAEYITRLDHAGFLLYNAYPAFTDDRTGQTLQWDALFVKKSLVPS